MRRCFLSDIVFVSLGEFPAWRFACTAKQNSGVPVEF